ncbi:hypothetical protein NEOLI_000660 [Neolecta irregularis DAH-3]|uniref:Uncharacterized protein n=1 Tax=Neolecta irregularis (strain DAH-3) TaxID=1198029 RepID=A0A1U7LSX9_NEOID|nr:hypothetical protein NEOLI_000660 [Neolecta irregularis DAH-3]|eukprot:OLL25775.1 hypothetical protein NEOLI_000660 [Neolecta irregularis DAH-3]
MENNPVLAWVARYAYLRHQAKTCSRKRLEIFVSFLHSNMSCSDDHKALRVLTYRVRMLWISAESADIIKEDWWEA